jgi:predicted molibdopterin-dependent oxidoreductase YjgC
VPAAAGLDATGILEAAAAGKLTTLVLLGADPLRDFPDAALAKKALAAVPHVIAVDLFVTDSAREANVVLAAAGPTEVDGSFTNLEGRVTALRRKVTPPGTAREDRMIAADLAARLGHDLGLESVAQIRDELAALAAGTYGPLVTDALDARDGFVVTGGSVRPAARERAALPKGDAYSLRLVVTRSMYDLGTLVQHSPSSAHLAPGTAVLVHPADFDRLDLPAGTRVKVTSSRGSVRTVVQPHAGVPRGVAAMLFNQPDADVGVLLDARAAAVDVRVERA